MDLSGIIFVALALGWAGYLIPMALKHHDEIARTRRVDRFSRHLRVLRRNGAGSATGSVEVDDEVTVERAVSAAPSPLRHSVTRESARAAARRRRHVLLGLLGVLVVVTALAGFSVLPWWSLAAPVVLVAAFLVVARITVARTQQAHGGATATTTTTTTEHVETVAAPHDIDATRDREDTVGISRELLAAAVSVPPLEDEGSLWDPLPVTLPTYVGKPAARRTVRSIELTGMTSSGRDAADSALVRETEAAEAEARTDEHGVRVVRRASGS